MKIVETEFKGLFLIQGDVFKDNRGAFVQLINDTEADKFGIDLSAAQHQYSVSEKGVVRGMHFQLPPYGQSKMVTCVHGKICDVVIDVRKSSPTYKKFGVFELSAEKGDMLFIPQGFAHGFQALTSGATVMYQVSHHWVPSSERGIHVLKFGFDWPIQNGIVTSEKDVKHPTLDEFDSEWE